MIAFLEGPELLIVLAIVVLVFGASQLGAGWRRTRAPRWPARSGARDLPETRSCATLRHGRRAWMVNRSPRRESAAFMRAWWRRLTRGEAAAEIVALVRRP